MITNANINIFRREVDQETKLEKYTNVYFGKCWSYLQQNTQNNGVSVSNVIRIPGNDVNVKIGDLIIMSDVEIKDVDVNIAQKVTNVVINSVGNNQHVRINAE